jgi:hypothetical protein
VRPGTLSLLLLCWPSIGSAQSLSVTARSVYHAYQIQLFPGQQGGPERNLNRFYQTLEAGTWFLGPGGNISAVLSMRYDTDFGTGFREDTPAGAGIPAAGNRNDLDLLYLYVDWANLIDRRLDARLGRQLQLDDLDWYSFDGIKLTVHVLDPGEDHLDVELYAGLPVRYEQLFASEPFINDGVQVDDAPGYFGGLAVGGNVSFRMFGLSLSGAYRQELIFRDDELEPFPTGDEAAARSAGKFSMQESLIGFSAGYTYSPFGLDLYGRMTWNLLVGELDQARAGAGWTPWRGFHIGAEYLRSRPRFLGDSIWNFFNLLDYDKGRFELSMQFLEWFELSLGYYLQFFHGTPIATGQGRDPAEYEVENGAFEFAGSDFNHGPSGGLTFRWQPLSAGVYFEGSSNVSSDYAYGGNYRYGHVFADAELLDGWIGGTLRFSLTTFQNDWFEEIDSGTVDRPHNSFALHVGVRSRIYRWVTIRVAFTKNFSQELEGSHRVYSELGLHY